MSAFIIWSPDYTYMHSGVRCLFLLCHHLNRLGHEAYITGRNAPDHLQILHADPKVLAERRMRGLDDIVIYPEIVKGNPLQASKVIRYLLNVPGALNDTNVGDYGTNDYVVHYAAEYRHPALKSRSLKIPLIDRTIFHRGKPTGKRKGFIIYSVRYKPGLSTLPKWVKPITLAYKQKPIDPATMAELYRRSRALVVWEHTAAVGEAMHCGCPVVMMPRPGIDYRRLAFRCLGCGYAIGWNRRGIKSAAKTVGVATMAYRLRHAGLDWRLHRFVRQARRYFATLEAASHGGG